MPGAIAHLGGSGGMLFQNIFGNFGSLSVPDAFWQQFLDRFSSDIYYCKQLEL